MHNRCAPQGEAEVGLVVSPGCVGQSLIKLATTLISIFHYDFGRS
jgi:hypothetical protein